MRLFVVLAVAVAGCADATGRIAVSAPQGGPRPLWQQQMDQARQMASEGKTYVVVGPSQAVAFHNNPRPFCYTYAVPGIWRVAGAGAFRSFLGER